ncbi:ubiquitin-protein ligase e3a-related [Holotrichia oblita]|uniref:Ubiquitin-protein ligase e3a-related n=1 Tax=Holotrichia oblita TaxID=644536 RepID=A0ACB9SQ58_HOLOL|nr:ubiquitin-protein ligase e3a-related [Holotrichia oblita]
MFAWGSTVHGELGLGGIEDEHILAPRNLDWYKAGDVIQAACGANHTLLLANDGKVYSCGNNDFGQLGHDQPRKRPQLVSSLDAHSISQVACGASHSLALNQWGQVFAWGSDNYGQLGLQLGSDNVQPVPKILKALATYHVIQIACGENHSIALTNNGDLFAWGANNCGQLGIGTVTAQESNPTVVSSLTGIPIALIACGGNHTFALSKSGAVFGWGKNTMGQLGLNDTNQRSYPCQLRTLRNIKVRFISCGSDFSSFLTIDGGVLTCGAGMCGQLGHGNLSNEILPRQVLELMGSIITQITCGRQHTLALVPSRGRVYSFGLGGSGQLGGRKPGNSSTPQVVLGPWVSPSGISVLPDSSENIAVKRIFAGGDHCFALCSNRSNVDSPFDARFYSPTTQILTLELGLITTCSKITARGTIDLELLGNLETIFKSLSCLNGSFLLPNDEHYYCTSKHHGVDVPLAETIFGMIAKFENDSLKNLIWSCITDDLLKKLSPSPPDVETLRIYLTLPLYHEFYNPKQHIKLHRPFVSAVLGLKTQANRVISSWWSSMTNEYFEKLVMMFKGVANYIIRNMRIPDDKTVTPDGSLIAMLDILALLNRLNHKIDGLKVAYDTFHINDLGEVLDVRIDYIQWLTDDTVRDIETIFTMRHI